MSGSVTGLSETEAALAKVVTRVEAMAAPALRAAGKRVADDAAEHVRRTKGAGPHVADDIQVGEPVGNGREQHVLVGPSKRTGWRAKFLEFGTRHAGAFPFLRPALDKNRAAIVQLLRESSVAAIKGV